MKGKRGAAVAYRLTKPQLAMKKKDHIQDKKLSVCTDCRYGIFQGQEYVWTNRGMVHKGCYEIKVAA